jgi:hypothetical protein
VRSKNRGQSAAGVVDVSKQLAIDEWWPVDPVFAESYASHVAMGREMAGQLDSAIVMIARNARPYIVNTLIQVEQLRDKFHDSSVYVFENDSTDGTDRLLDEYAEGHFGAVVEHETLGGEDHRGFGDDRTNRLAYCRNKCLDWVRQHAATSAWTIVLDCDPHGGFSVDGVLNSIAWLGDYAGRAGAFQAGGMASYSAMKHDLGRTSAKILQYDAWAARLNDWRDRRLEVGFEWFHWLLPPVGSPPIQFFSAFGGLAVYTTPAFLAGGYEGGDCEHVPHHRRMWEAGYQMYLNPGCRYAAI